MLKNFPGPLAGKKSRPYVAAKRSTGREISEFPKPFWLPLRLHAPAIFSMSWEDPMKFRPLHDRVVVRRIEAEEKSVGGIIIPDTAKEKPSQGEVIAVGPGGRDEAGKLIPIDVREGDRVLFGKWSGTEVKIDGEELLIMKESDIMGIIDERASKKKAA
jgi:chaperonin GroES